MSEPMTTNPNASAVAANEGGAGPAGETFGRIETAFRARRAEGRKLLVPFITGGVSEDWTELLRAAAAAGADAIEVGIPFSDPVMDGPVIQEASTIALGRGATPYSVLREAAAADVDVPLVAMTSYNIAFRAGHHRYAELLSSNGFSGAILPDLPLEECTDWGTTASSLGIENVLLAAPTSTDERLVRICAASRGWIYGIGTLGVTGERATLAATAGEIAARLKAVTDRPVLVGVGVSNAEQAREVAATADGVIVGASVMRRVLEGQGADGVARYVAELRAGLDDL
jgi:tryptophan synthase alpha chain